VAHEHAVLAVRLGRRRDVPEGQRRGDPREGGQRRLVAAGVQRERGLSVVDREPLDGDDLPAIDVGRHQVPGDGVLDLAAEDRPGRDVQPGVRRQRAIVEVDRGADPGEDVVGDQSQVGDAQQDVGRVLVERTTELGAGSDDSDAPLERPLPDDLVRRRDQDDIDALCSRRLCALLHQRLVAHQHTARPARAVRALWGRRKPTHVPSSLDLWDPRYG
jgi:hypothetical protein